MMKRHLGILTAILVTAVVALVGCGGSKTVDTSALEKSFSAAEATLKASADKAVTAIKNADYKPALEELQKLAANIKLTDEQKKAINDVLERVQKLLTEQATKAVGEATKKVEDLQKSLPK